MMTLELRTTYCAATLKDINDLLKLVQEFHEFEHLPFDSKLDRIALEQLLKDDSLGKVWLIRESDQSIGYVIVTFAYSLEFRGRGASVDELYLRPAYRGRGIGTKVLRFVEQVCRSMGINALCLVVAEGNDRAQHVYRNVGYHDRGYHLMTKSILNDQSRLEAAIERRF